MQSASSILVNSSERQKAAHLFFDQSQAYGHELLGFLSQTYSLYLKTQYFNWNLLGTKNAPLMKLLEEQHTDLAEVIDLITPRVCALGLKTPTNLTEFLQIADCQEKNDVLSAEQMVNELINDHQRLANLARNIFCLAHKNQDAHTADILVKRVQIHERQVWNLQKKYH